MNYRVLAEVLGIEHTEIIDEDLNSQEIIDNYVPWGGGGAGHKNGHFGCKHTDEAKKIMSDLKKGKTTWNKGKKGFLVHSEESKKAMGEKLSGSQNGRAILNEDIVRNIIDEYLSQPSLPKVGEIQRNGLPMSYDWAFCKHTAQNYNTTPAAIKRLIQKKSWKNVWSEY